jgi:hypothetical protein
LEEAIVISYNQREPEEWVEDLTREVEAQNFKVRKFKREESGAWAAIEWSIPTLAVAILLQPFFKAFLTEAGKDAYRLTKEALKKFILKNRGIKLKWMAAAEAINKLSKTYDQSLSISIKAQIDPRLTVTVLFNENVPDEEASDMVESMYEILERLYQKCQEESPDKVASNDHLSKNNVYLIANNESQQWELLTDKQIADKYRNKPTAEVLNDKIIENQKIYNTPLNMSEVFISYSWDSPEHEQKVVDLTNHLRAKGFHTTIDKMISQEKTAINFVRMMHQALLEHPKVIVVLSKGYKQKAETFTGGVGEEYEILINDIKKNENKYILASFDGRGDDIVPIGLKGRDIVDLSKAGEEERLLEKLLDHHRYQFVEVADKKPELRTVAPQPFIAEIKPIPIEILPPRITPTGDTSATGGQYRRVDLVVDIEFKNVSSKPVTEFGGLITVHKLLMPDHRQFKVVGDLVLVDVNVARKVFPGQTTSGLQWKFELNRGNIYRAMDSEIVISLYTDDGNGEARFNFKDLIYLKPPNEQWREPQLLSLALFVS